MEDIDVCLEQSGWLLESLPMEERTYSRCLLAARSARKRFTDCESILCVIPPAFRTSEVCLAAIINNGDALRDVPTELRTYDLCLEAVKRWGEALCDVPREIVDLTLCTTAVARYGMAILSVPQEYMSEALALLAVFTAPRALRVLPESLRTLEVCETALRDPWTMPALFNCIPEEYRCQILYGLDVDSPY